MQYITYTLLQNNTIKPLCVLRDRSNLRNIKYERKKKGGSDVSVIKGGIDEYYVL